MTDLNKLQVSEKHDPVSIYLTSIWILGRLTRTTSIVFNFTEPLLREISLNAKNFINKVQSFANLKPNWDSYGADVPSNETIKKAIEYIRNTDKKNISPYFTAPGPNGEIVVEYRSENRQVEIYFNHEDKNELFFYEGSELKYEGFDLSIDIVDFYMEDKLEFIEDTDVLYRRVPFLDPRFIRDDGSISSFAFKTKKESDGLSVDIAKLTIPEKSVLDKTRFWLYSLIAFIPRGYNLDCIHNPMPDNYAHALITGNITKAIASALAGKAIRVKF